MRTTVFSRYTAHPSRTEIASTHHSGTAAIEYALERFLAHYRRAVSRDNNFPPLLRQFRYAVRYLVIIFRRAFHFFFSQSRRFDFAKIATRILLLLLFFLRLSTRNTKKNPLILFAVTNDGGRVVANNIQFTTINTVEQCFIKVGVVELFLTTCKCNKLILRTAITFLTARSYLQLALGRCL